MRNREEGDGEELNVRDKELRGKCETESERGTDGERDEERDT